MPALFLAMLGALVASFGARDQRLVAQLRGAFGPALPLLASALVASTASSALAAWFGVRIGHGMSEDAVAMLTAFALLFAGVELLLPIKVRPLEEPTRSAGATLLALLAKQVTDAARFLVLALSIAFPATILVAIGGAIGSGAALVLAWSAPEFFANSTRLVLLRRLLAFPVLLGGIVVGLQARGLIG